MHKDASVEEVRTEYIGIDDNCRFCHLNSPEGVC